MSINSQQKTAYGLALLVVLLWSTISSAFKITLRFLPFEELVFWSVVNGVLVLTLVNQLGKQPLRIKTLTTKNYLSSALMGFFNPFLYYLVLIKAYDLLEAQVAGTLNYFWPIVLVFFSIVLLGQKIHAKGLIAIFISFLGIVIISTGGNPFSLHFTNTLGVVLAVASAFLWAFYWILNMKDQREGTGKILLNMIFGLIYLVLWFLIRGQWPHLPTINGYFGTLYIGIFEMGITFVIWLKALKLSSDTAKVSNLIYLSPFLGLFWISFIVGENIHLSTVVGLAFIVGGILIQAKR
ncbi:MAG: EamA/RhaT family transporter [Bacteroidetes bacterium]|nr:MAG: EamA/RhaT family transporter [Bacteroidota bacterium]